MSKENIPEWLLQIRIRQLAMKHWYTVNRVSNGAYEDSPYPDMEKLLDLVYDAINMAERVQMHSGHPDAAEGCRINIKVAKEFLEGLKNE